MLPIARPDLSQRPYSLSCEHVFAVDDRTLFEAWTTRFDRWFAQPGTLVFTPEPGRPYFFYNRDEWGRHPHYGRVLEVKEFDLIELTWLTGNGEKVGTEGAETVLRIELAHEGESTRVRLMHTGFVSEESRKAHAENWPLALQALAGAVEPHA